MRPSAKRERNSQPPPQAPQAEASKVPLAIWTSDAYLWRAGPEPALYFARMNV
jgi:hypothetical protein